MILVIDSSDLIEKQISQFHMKRTESVDYSMIIDRL